MVDADNCSDVADMEVFDRLPQRLKDFLNEAPMGVDATSVEELYRKKQGECWADDDDPVGMTIKVLQIYMNMKGCRDFRPVRARPGCRKHRPQRRLRVPKWLMKR